MRMIGLGGGGEMAAPSVSPKVNTSGLPAAMFRACDMGGLYRSTDGGASWRMLDTRLIKSETTALRVDEKNVPRCRVAFDRNAPSTIYAYGPKRGGLRRSRDLGNTWDTPAIDDPAKDIFAICVDPLAAASMSPSPVLYGTMNGVTQLLNG